MKPNLKLEETFLNFFEFFDYSLLQTVKYVFNAVEAPLQILSVENIRGDEASFWFSIILV